MKPLHGRGCKRCGISLAGEASEKLYCSRRCTLMDSFGVALRTSSTICPVIGCPNGLRRSSLVVCHACWMRLPLDVKERVAGAWHDWKRLGTQEASDALEEARTEAVIAASPEGIAASLRIRQRARKKARARLGLAA